MACTVHCIHGGCEHVYTALHKANKVCFDELIASVPGKRKRNGKGQGSEEALSVDPLLESEPASSSASGSQNDEITERLIARSIASYEFFQVSKEKRQASRLTRL